MASLSIVEGPAEGKKFALANNRVVMIGREEDCTFQVLDPRISRLHLQIKLDEHTKSHSAFDFDSANGVLVNGNRISGKTPLSDGDLIRIGNTAIIYSVTDDPDAQTLTQLLRRHGECRFETEM